MLRLCGWPQTGVVYTDQQTWINTGIGVGIHAIAYPSTNRPSRLYSVIITYYVEVLIPEQLINSVLR